ncbi:uncharacterized protein LOC117181202 [Belonocnema kinseyi]|uniref:uncharacterized protein LOC117181202 n=1 Tax=Belonocnema kinseyi TaxID=2817044 RepID=UPI00143DA59A|nr:uncharacterized protein LOC117181202 [Belonocnema kinseyi]
MAALHPAQDHVNQGTSYPHYNSELKHDGISFPVTLEDIQQSKKMNRLCINVEDIENDNKKYKKAEIVQLYLSKAKSRHPTIHLLMIENTKFYSEYANENESNDSDPIYHLTLIKNLSRLVKSQFAKDRHRTLLCDRCLCHFKFEKSFQNHKSDCENSNQCRMILPKKLEKCLKFKNYRFNNQVSFSVYAAIECLLLELSENPFDIGPYQKHVAYSVAFYLHCSFDDSSSKLQIYRGQDYIEWFVNELKEIAQNIDSQLTCIVPMEKLTTKQEMEFLSAKNCHICEEPFTENNIRHHDHNHFTDKFCGVSHQGCNVNYKDSHTVPVVFHNLSGYDSHFIIKALAKQFEDKVKLLPVNKEKYISFTKYVAGTKVNLRFIDSFCFMPSSLEKLSSYLGNKDKKITLRHCNNPDEYQ